MARNTDLAGQQYMLAGLRHRAVRGGNDQDRAIHLRRASDHVFDVVRVARAVDVGIMALVGFIFHVSNIDRNAALSFFRRFVDLIVGEKLRLALLLQNLRNRRS